MMVALKVSGLPEGEYTLSLPGLSSKVTVYVLGGKTVNGVTATDSYAHGDVVDSGTGAIKSISCDGCAISICSYKISI